MATLAPEFSLLATVEPDAPVQTSHAKRSGRLARFFETVGVKNSVSVSLQAIDQGQAVMAQVDGLDRDQRLKLRDRIVALLSRHGLAAHSVRIDGHSGIPAAFEKER